MEFIRRSEEKRAKSADCLIDGEVWEMKAPESDKLKVIEKNLRKALKQSHNIVFDARRMKRLPDRAIRRETAKWCSELGSVRHLIYVDRYGEVALLK